MKASGCFLWGRGVVVGTVHTEEGLLGLERRTPQGVDAVEIRLDCLQRRPRVEALRRVGVPIIVTPRHLGEGGSLDWGEEERVRALEPLLAVAGAVDIELRLLGEGRKLQEKARGAGVPILLSFHDFVGVPEKGGELLERYEEAREEGAAVFKVAATLRKPRDIEPLLELLERAEGRELPVAAMGMGEYGRASRVYLAAAGSVLNYGWLHRPQVPGQYPARLLKKRLVELAGV